MNAAFYREEPSQRRVHRLIWPDAAVLTGLECAVWLRPDAKREDAGTLARKVGLVARAPQSASSVAGACGAQPPIGGARGPQPPIGGACGPQPPSRMSGSGRPVRLAGADEPHSVTKKWHSQTQITSEPLICLRSFWWTSEELCGFA